MQKSCLQTYIESGTFAYNGGALIGCCRDDQMINEAGSQNHLN
jgi:hypothetical protein